jgi:type IV pilus assembly protein PilQ
VFEFQNCRLGSGLERRLDTSEFASAVRAISSYVSRTTGSDVRVVVDLREAVEWEIETGDAGVLINFPVPASVAASVYQAPEVSSSVELPEIQTFQDEGDYQESALLRETMIGGGGEIVDPTRALRTEEGIFSGALGGSGRFTGRAINLDMVNADIHNVFRLISHVSGLNIVSSDEVSGEVTVRLVDVPWDQALVAIL